MQSRSTDTLWHMISRPGRLGERVVYGGIRHANLRQLSSGTSLPCSSDYLRGRSVLLATTDQFAAALALIELDTLARRVVLCPPDLADDHLSGVMSLAKIDLVITDETNPCSRFGSSVRVVTCLPDIEPVHVVRAGDWMTEWVLLTSGTTGMPKLVCHTLFSLSDAIVSNPSGPDAVWATFYDIRRYGGLQVLLRGLLGGGSLVLGGVHELTAEFLSRAGRHGVTHISGTPSHWRRALMSTAAAAIAPRYVRLSGEIADQGTLDRLREFFRVPVGHAFASTEAGVAFEVDDGLAGFPRSYIDAARGRVEMKVEDGTLWIRSPRTARRYLGSVGKTLRNAEDFVDTADQVELQDGRYMFVGRKDGVVNIGGMKVHPEEVESIINAVPGVAMSVVLARISPITGAVLMAHIVARDGHDDTVGQHAEIKARILDVSSFAAAIQAACRHPLCLLPGHCHLRQDEPGLCVASLSPAEAGA